MKVIKINHPHQYRKSDFPEMAMALGYFDGVHLGHQSVISVAKMKADQNGWKSAVMTFDPHPSVVLGKSVQHAEYITPISTKIDLIEKLGIDYLFIVNFTVDFANLLPQEFIDHYIIDLNVKHVVAGFDFSYGRMGKGNMETLPFHSRDQFDFTTVPKYVHGDQKVSSTLIRTEIQTGNVSSLPSLLGGYYTTSGIVSHGDKRGRTLGFPTANIEMTEDYLLPPSGVYAVRIKIDQTWYNGVCNRGYKPTFYQEKDKQTIEVHIFDFSNDIYGKTVTVEWHLRLRSEQKFAGIDQLVTQIEKDKQNAYLYFERNNI
ncbi:bifunctional riboflavin kinase/FAD synthetase [Neobacillus sp. LXY-4]|uniref:bifunctional riboflavin kinase/FAD synthetase n=1 Tax=Neobacillus sp. LXY-4 TaxID=3379826 RepID=UPI003EE1DA23